VSRGCRDSSGVIRPLREGAEVSDEGDCRRRVTDADVALLHALYTSVHTLEKASETCHFVPLFGTFRTPFRRDSSLGKALRHHEIGHEVGSGGPSRNRVA